MYSLTYQTRLLDVTMRPTRQAAVTHGTNQSLGLAAATVKFLLGMLEWKEKSITTHKVRDCRSVGKSVRCSSNIVCRYTF